MLVAARLPAPEVLRVGDVVVVERERNVELAHEVEERAADREVVEDPRVVARAHPARERARVERLVAHVVVRVDRVDVGFEAGVAQQPAEPERVHPDRVATGERREELVDLGHDSDGSSGGRGLEPREPRSSSCTRASSCSMRSAAALPTDVAAQPSARICSVRWLVVKNTGLAHDLLRRAHAAVARVDRRERLHVGLLLEQGDRGADVARRGGAQRESAGLCRARGRRTRWGSRAARRSFARGGLDLGAYVVLAGRLSLREGAVGRAVIRHGSNASGRMRGFRTLARHRRDARPPLDSRRAVGSDSRVRCGPRRRSRHGHLRAESSDRGTPPLGRVSRRPRSDARRALRSSRRCAAPVVAGLARRAPGGVAGAQPGRVLAGAHRSREPPSRRPADAPHDVEGAEPPDRRRAVAGRAAELAGDARDRAARRDRVDHRQRVRHEGAATARRSAGAARGAGARGEPPRVPGRRRRANAFPAARSTRGTARTTSPRSSGAAATICARATPSSPKELIGCDPVVDLGFGRGEFMELLTELGVTVRGVEPDPQLVTSARGAGSTSSRGSRSSTCAGSSRAASAAS